LTHFQTADILLGMYRFAVTSVFVVLTTAGCGSGGGTGASNGGARSDDGATSSAPAPSATASTGFFVGADTAAINKAAAAAQKASTRAASRAGSARCNRARSEGYPSWRACWHELLDPLQLSLNGLATELNTLASHDLPHACVTELGKAAETFAGFSSDVEKLLIGIDSGERSRQSKAMRDFSPTLDTITAGYTKPFQELTQVCYSPQDLESINASPGG
jgi:hypothetical protein